MPGEERLHFGGLLTGVVALAVYFTGDLLAGACGLALVWALMLLFYDARWAANVSGLSQPLRLAKTVVAVKNCRTIGKADMIHNSATPKIEVDPETYEVRADGELLVCEPAKVLPMAQRYFLF